VSKKHNHIEQLTPALLEAYRNRLLTAEQEHQVEKLMLEDPFYADALEGLESITPTDLAHDLNELHTRLNDRLAKEKRVVFWTSTRRMAAALFFLIAVSFIFIWLKPKNESVDNITANKETETNTRPIADSIALINPDAFEKPKLSASNLNTKPKSIDPIQSIVDISESEMEFDFEIEELGEVVSTAEAEAPPKPKLEINIAESAKTRMEEVERMKASNSVVEEKLEMDKASSMNIQSKLQGRAHGIQITPTNITLTVVDADDLSPLPQVTVLIKNTIEGVPTNMDGKAELRADSSEVYVVRFLGYVSQEFRLTDLAKKNNTIKLEPDVTSLSEVVVTGYGTSVPSEDLSRSAIPEIGNKEFNQYIKENLVYPKEAESQRIKGRVTVEFVVSSDGSLSNFFIKKGLGAGCDEEAIRLIKEGPRWLPALDRNGNALIKTVRVRILFKP
jgi:TonB family protein